MNENVLSDNEKLIVRTIGRTGETRQQELLNVLIEELTNDKTPVREKMQIRSQMHFAFRRLTDAGVLTNVKPPPVLACLDVSVYELTEVGKKLYFRLYGKKPKDAGTEKFVREKVMEFLKEDVSVEKRKFGNLGKGKPSYAVCGYYDVFGRFRYAELYDYDGNGNLVKFTEYDEKMRTTEITMFSYADGETLFHTTVFCFENDPEGKLIGKTKHEYDSADDVLTFETL